MITFGVCTTPANGVLLASNGYQFIEQSVGSFLMPDKSDEAFRINLAATRALSPLPTLACNAFLTGPLRVTGPEANHDSIVAYANIVFRRAKDAGVKFIVFGSGAARKVPDGFPMDQAVRQFADLLKRLGPLAQSNGIVIAIEPLHAKECNFINSLAEADAVASLVNHPAVKLLADFYHMAQDNESPAEITRFAAILVHIHVADPVTRKPPTADSAARLAPYLDALKKAGYAGGISIECGGGDTIAQWAKEARNVMSQPVSGSDI